MKKYFLVPLCAALVALLTLAATFGPVPWVSDVSELILRRPLPTQPAVLALGYEELNDNLGGFWVHDPLDNTTNTHALAAIGGGTWKRVRLLGNEVGSTTVYVNGLEVIDPDFSGSDIITWFVSGSTVQPLIEVGSIPTNRIDSVFHQWVLSQSGGGGEPSDGDKGDITVSSSGTVWTIDAGAVSTNKIDTTFHQWVSGKADAFSTGNLVAGSNVTLDGTLTGRLVGAGNVTINATGGGSGTNTWKLEVNSAEVIEPNLSDTTPSADFGHQNVKFQVSGSDVSAQLDTQDFAKLSATDNVFVGNISASTVNATNLLADEFETTTLIVTGGADFNSITNQALTAHRPVFTGANKELISAVIGSGLSYDSGTQTLSATGGGGSSVFINGAEVVNPNFNDTTPAAGTGYRNVEFQVTGTNASARLDLTGLTGGGVTVSTNNQGFLQRSANVVVVDETGGETLAYAWTIPAGLLSVDGDEVDIFVPAGFIPYTGQGNNGYGFTVYWDDASFATVVQYQLATNHFAASSSTYSLDWRLRIKRTGTNTALVSVSHSAGDEPLLSSNTGDSLVSATLNQQVTLTGMSWLGNDVTFSLWASIASAERAADLTFRGYTMTKVGSGSGGGGGGSKTIAVLYPSLSDPPASNYATFWTRNSRQVLEFDDTTNESRLWAGSLVEGADLTSGINVIIDWVAKTATSGNVRWCARLERGNTDIDSDSFDTAQCATGTANGTSGVITRTTITLTNLDSLGAGEPYWLMIYRDPADTGNDTMTGDAQFLIGRLDTVD